MKGDGIPQSPPPWYTAAGNDTLLIPPSSGRYGGVGMRGSPTSSTTTRFSVHARPDSYKPMAPVQGSEEDRKYLERFGLRRDEDGNVRRGSVKHREGGGIRRLLSRRRKVELDG
jgi:hypothetical protein